jgi:hypothetical protein
MDLATSFVAKVQSIYSYKMTLTPSLLGKSFYLLFHCAGVMNDELLASSWGTEI